MRVTSPENAVDVGRPPRLKDCSQCVPREMIGGRASVSRGCLCAGARQYFRQLNTACLFGQSGRRGHSNWQGPQLLMGCADLFGIKQGWRRRVEEG